MKWEIAKEKDNKLMTPPSHRWLTSELVAVIIFNTNLNSKVQNLSFKSIREPGCIPAIDDSPQVKNNIYLKSQMKYSPFHHSSNRISRSEIPKKEL